MLIEGFASGGVSRGETAAQKLVLREPPQRPDGKGDVLSYHLREAEALKEIRERLERADTRAAEAYTRRSQRRAVVALLLWDEFWF